MKITKDEFRELTGEDPEDVLGNDWENEVEEFDEEFGLVKINKKVGDNN